jgi:hypothetical protein
MKIRKLVAFGCSWTYGDGLVDPTLKKNSNDITMLSRCPDNESYRLQNSYPGLIAQHYQADLENCACFGGSLESMRWSLFWWLKNNNIENDTLFLFGLADSSRQSWFNPDGPLIKFEPDHNNHVHSAWINSDCPEIKDTQWEELQKLWVGMSYNQEWRNYNFYQAVHLFDHINSRYNVPVIQFNVTAPSVRERGILLDVPSLRDPNFVYSGWLRLIEKQKNISCFLNDRPNPNACHPNELGHKLIADHLIKYIDQC